MALLEVNLVSRGTVTGNPATVPVFPGSGLVPNAHLRGDYTGNCSMDRLIASSSFCHSWSLSSLGRDSPCKPTESFSGVLVRCLKEAPASEPRVSSKKRGENDGKSRKAAVSRARVSTGKSNSEKFERIWRGKVSPDKFRNTDSEETLWRELFSDPAQWWDNRVDKPNPKLPDFKHKQSGKALWVLDMKTPQWVASEIASLATGLSCYSWGQRLAQYNKAKQFEKTMELFLEMQPEGIEVDAYVFVPILNACAALHRLDEGRRIHKLATETGHEVNLYVSSCLVDMYAKCGSIDEAWGVFDKMPKRNVVAFTSMILGCVKGAQGQKAFELYEQMQKEGVQPNSITFVGLVNACSSLAAGQDWRVKDSDSISPLEKGRLVHEQIVNSGFGSDVYVGSSLVNMYAKCGSIDEAWKVFEQMPTRNVVAWTAMLGGFTNCDQGRKALKLYKQMLAEGIEPTSVTYVGVLNACASVGALEEGRKVHKQITRSGCESALYVGSSLVDMYAKCGSIEDAQLVFSRMPVRNVVAWNGMILGSVKCGQGLKALELFEQMQREEVEPDSVTFVGLLNACAKEAALQEGKGIHEQIIRSGFESNVSVGGGLVDMYAKCGSMDEARKVFDNLSIRSVVAWNGMILGSVKSVDVEKAFDYYQQMQQEGVRPNHVTFLTVLSACAKLAALEQGKRVHDQIIQSGFESDMAVGSSLVDMYARCGSIDDAQSVFDKMPTPKVVTWNAMIMGYGMQGDANQAVAIFEQMVGAGSAVDEVTFLSLLSACKHGGLVKEGMDYFESMKSVYGVSPTVEHYTCMVDILGNAGRLNDAEELLKTMKNV